MNIHQHFTTDQGGPYALRELDGVQVGTTWLTVEPIGRDNEGRLCWRYVIDGPEVAYEGADLSTGPQHQDDGNGHRAAMGALLSFLSASAESYWTGGENADLFPPTVVEWATQHSDELAMVSAEMEGDI